MGARKWPITAEIDRMLRRIYKDDSRMTLVEYAKQLGYPYETLSARARQLGISRQRKEGRWMPEEELIIIRNIHRTIPLIHQQLVASGYERGYESVKTHIKRTQLRFYNQYLTVEQVAAGFGVERVMVEGWIARGLLRALEVEKTEAAYVLAPERISGVWVLDFCRAHPNEYEASKMDDEWRRRFVAINGMVNREARRHAHEAEEGENA